MQWNEIIGQNHIKRTLEYRLKSYSRGEPILPHMICAPKGQGKTSLCEAFGRLLREQTNGAKRVFTINSASIGNMRKFWDSIIIPHVQDKDVTLILDEASELPNDVSMSLLTMINPNQNHHNSFTYDDMTVDIDLQRNTFLFATTEPQKVFTALMNRCSRIDLEDYTLKDLGDMVLRNCNCEISEDALNEIVLTLRGNARTAAIRSADISSYIKSEGLSKVNLKDWRAIRGIFDILPMGLNRQELRLLRVLASGGQYSLTNLASCLGLTKASVQRDLELYLQQIGFIKIVEGSKRVITNRGNEYLKTLC